MDHPQKGLTGIRPPFADPLVGGGEMGALMRSINWSRTPLGPVAQWPASLKTTAGLVLNNPFPMLLWWGPEFRQIYNDGYRPILGDKHPESAGAPAAVVWAEVWDVLGPMARTAYHEGRASWREHLLLLLARRGFIEETFFTFSYSPVPGDDGRIGGVLVTVQETTEQVQAGRQLRMLRDLAAQSALAKSAGEACRVACLIMDDYRADVPFSLVYLVDRNRAEARLVGSSGLDTYDGPAKPERIALDASAAAAWPLAQAEEFGSEILVENLGGRFGPLPDAPWGTPPHTAVVVPLARPGQSVYGFLVCGVSARRALDDRYRGLFRLTADQIVMAVANARAYEEERERAEALAQLDRAKTTFFSNISHEFRTPLSLMLGPLSDARISPDRTLKGEDLEAVHRNARRLLKLVNSLLDFSRIEAGRAQPAFEPIDLSALTAELAAGFRTVMARGGLELRIDCPPLPQPVYVDADMWERIVLNLLSNAFKYTFEGHVSVSLTSHGDTVEFTVADTGIGIAPEHMPDLFARFHRILAARARTHEGSGIGLALVHELVRLHGGRIAVASEPGKGTAFTISLLAGSAHLPAEAIGPRPLTPVESIDATAYVEEALRWLPQPEVPSSMAPMAAAGLILLADDNLDMRDYVGRLLRERWEVQAVSNGLEALTAARARCPDLVITDVMMPELDGFGLLRALRADPATANVPVLMLSARAGEESRAEGLEAGADDYLVKPFSARELIARIEAQLLRSRMRLIEDAHKRRLTEVFLQAPVGIAILRGPEHVYEFANPPYLALIGNRDVIGKPIRRALPELADQGILELLDSVYESATPFVGRSVRAVLDNTGTPGGEECFFDFVYQPMRDPAGQVEGIAIVTFEVTELANARREAESANRAKDEFLAMLGHELRNPLAPILTALQLMRLRGLPGAERERLVIERQVQHVVGLVDDLLDVSRITRGKIQLKRLPFEIAEAVGKAIEMASPLLEERQHELRVEVATAGLGVDGDRDRLAQVIANLLTNAAKYTEPGGRITVAASARSGDVVLTVRDTGMGIDPEMLPSIFERFTQERQALDRSQGGLGLGLAIVRSLVTMHGGSVSAHSPGPGLGSEFTVTLPLVAVPHADTRSLAASRARPSTAGVRVLIVDDNDDAAMMLSDCLLAAGHATRVARDGPTALRLAAEFRPQVGLLDIGLPVMDGYELARRFRDDPDLSSIRLIAVTGYGQDHDRRRSASAGFHAHLVKPVDLEELELLVSEQALESPAE